MIFLLTLSGGGGEFFVITLGLLGQLIANVGAVILGIWIYDRYIKKQNPSN